MTFTVTIAADSTPVEVYGGLAAAVHYLNFAIGDGAVAWRGLSNDDQARMLVAATRYIDRLAWQGTATTPAVGGTVLQWPRTNVVDANGNAVDPNSVPANIVNAVFELAASFADDTDMQSYRDNQANVRSVRAEGVGVDFFSPSTSQDDGGPQLPPVVAMLVSQYFVDLGARSLNSGTDGVSSFDVDVSPTAIEDGEIIISQADSSSTSDDVDPWDRSWPV